jgi:hypothetical protein
MNLIIKLFFAAAAFGLILSLGLASQENSAAISANPMKANHQQYERIQETNMYVNGGK